MPRLTLESAHKVAPEPGLGGEGDVLGVAVQVHRVVRARSDDNLVTITNYIRNNLRLFVFIYVDITKCLYYKWDEME